MPVALKFKGLNLQERYGMIPWDVQECTTYSLPHKIAQAMVSPNLRQDTSITALRHQLSENNLACKGK